MRNAVKRSVICATAGLSSTTSAATGADYPSKPVHTSL